VLADIDSDPEANLVAGYKWFKTSDPGTGNFFISFLKKVSVV
jgi:hypothetical protein